MINIPLKFMSHVLILARFKKIIADRTKLVSQKITGSKLTKSRNKIKTIANFL